MIFFFPSQELRKEDKDLEKSQLLFLDVAAARSWVLGVAAQGTSRGMLQDADPTGMPRMLSLVP